MFRPKNGGAPAASPSHVDVELPTDAYLSYQITRDSKIALRKLIKFYEANSELRILLKRGVKPDHFHVTVAHTARGKEEVLNLCRTKKNHIGQTVTIDFEGLFYKPTMVAAKVNNSNLPVPVEQGIIPHATICALRGINHTRSSEAIISGEKFHGSFSLEAKLALVYRTVSRTDEDLTTVINTPQQMDILLKNLHLGVIAKKCERLSPTNGAGDRTKYMEFESIKDCYEFQKEHKLRKHPHLIINEDGPIKVILILTPKHNIYDNNGDYVSTLVRGGFSVFGTFHYNQRTVSNLTLAAPQGPRAGGSAAGSVFQACEVEVTAELKGFKKRLLAPLNSIGEDRRIQVFASIDEAYEWMTKNRVFSRVSLLSNCKYALILSPRHGAAYNAMTKTVAQFNEENNQTIGVACCCKFTGRCAKQLHDLSQQQHPHSEMHP